MGKRVLTITMNPSIDKTVSVKKLIPYGLNRVINSRIDIGGKGINVAKVLKSFGMDVTAAGLIAGKWGNFLLNSLKASGFSVEFTETCGEIRTNIKIVDTNVNRTTEINEPGFNVETETIQRFMNKFKTLAEKFDVIVLSGSLPPGVPQNFYSECIAAAKGLGKKTILDADGVPLKEGLKAVPFAVKPNIHELESLNGHIFSNKIEIVNAAKKLLKTGIEIVIVSMGADGAIVASKNEVFKADSWNVQVKSATGSGDSMVASLVYSVLNNYSLFDIAKITTAAGTITASKAGTQICSLNEVLQSLDKVTVTRI